MSSTIGKLAEALSKAQGEMKPAAKAGYNTFFKASYAPLQSVIDAVRGPFLSNGLAYCQPSRTDETGNVHVTTMIMHTSGEWISGESTAKPVKPDAQGIGSVISYLRRYGLQAMAGVSTADDDAETSAQHAAPKDGARAAVMTEFSNAVAAFKELGKKEAELLIHVKKSRDQLTYDDMDTLLAWYEELTREKQA